MLAINVSHDDRRRMLVRKVATIISILIFGAFCVPTNALAASATAAGNGGTINGYTVSTSSTAITNPTWFTASSYIRSNRQAAAGALRARTQLRVGVSTPHDFTVASGWSTNRSANTTVGATAQHNFSSNPGWGAIQATGTCGIYINGWHDFYAGIATAPITRAFGGIEALANRSGEYTDPRTGEVYLRAIGEQGRQGYIKQGEESIVQYMSPQELIDFISSSSGTVYINVYDEDLTTVIDSYPVNFTLS